jgi:hypothetical protein
MIHVTLSTAAQSRANGLSGVLPVFSIRALRLHFNDPAIRASLGISIHTQPGELVRRWQFERALNFVRPSKDKVSSLRSK